MTVESISRLFRARTPVTDTSRRRQWNPKQNRSRRRRRQRGKLARRKSMRLLAQHTADWIREKLNEESFTRRVLLPRATG